MKKMLLIFILILFHPVAGFGEDKSNDPLEMAVYNDSMTKLQMEILEHRFISQKVTWKGFVSEVYQRKHDPFEFIVSLQIKDHIWARLIMGRDTTFSEVVHQMQKEWLVKFSGFIKNIKISPAGYTWFTINNISTLEVLE